MQSNITRTQRQILNHLLIHKSGLSINALAEALKITRNAVQQHFTVLEDDGFIQKKHTNPTAGRPAAIYELTDRGINYFPKQYAWFCELILSEVLAEMGRERLPGLMQKLGRKLAASLHDRFADKVESAKLEELTALLTELGFQAELVRDPVSDEFVIDAFNCVYHDLAQQYPEICEFDLSLISSLLDKPLEHKVCMAKGGGRCCFVVKST